MAEVKKDKFITRTIRATEEAFDFLKELGDSEFANQGEALNYLVNLWNLESAKKSVGREKEIEDFQHLISRIGDLYIQSLALCADTEERVGQSFVDRLENQERTISDLRQGCDKAKAELAELKKINEEKNAAIALAEKERDQAKLEAQSIKSDHIRLQKMIDNANQTNDNMKKKIDELNGIAEENKNLNEQIAKNERKNNELQSKLDAKELQLKEFQNITEKNKELEEELKSVNKKCYDLQLMIDSAAIEAERKLNDAIAEERNTRLQEYVSMQTKYNSLNEKYDSLREKYDSNQEKYHQLLDNFNQLNNQK